MLYILSMIMINNYVGWVYAINRSVIQTVANEQPISASPIKLFHPGHHTIYIHTVYSKMGYFGVNRQKRCSGRVEVVIMDGAVV
jgi:hypothetical protein